VPSVVNSDRKVKSNPTLEKDLAMNELGMNELETQLTQLRHQSDLSQMQLAQATEEIPKTFLDAANGNSPSFALVKNDTSDVVVPFAALVGSRRNVSPGDAKSNVREKQVRLTA
jgi:hypothetical protein